MKEASARGRRAGESVAASVYRQINDDITSGQLTPGSLHTEASLADAYHVSKAPIRLALTLLQAEGSVTVLARRGVQIANVDLDDLRDAYALRGLIEPYASRLAAIRRSEADLLELRGLLESAKGRQRQDLEALQVRAHSRFHVAVARASAVRKIADIVRSLHDSMERFFNARPELGRAMEFGALDQELLSAIERRDPDAAESVARAAISLSAALTARVIAETLGVAWRTEESE